MHTIVTVGPSGTEAVARGVQIGMIGENNKSAYWTESVFVNRFVKQDGKWRIRDMRLYPKMKADYYQGWGKSAVVEPAPAKALAPDRPSPRVADSIPVLTFANPVTGAAAHYPKGKIVAGEPVRLSRASALAPSADFEARFAEAERKVNAAIAYDAVENLSSAFGWYDDDAFGDEAFWDDFVQLYTQDAGRAMPAVGIYYGRDRIRKAEAFGHAPGRVTPRTSLVLHMRIQPVIDVAPDGKSAKIRARLFQSGSSRTRSPSWNGGMYEDKAVLVNGAWLFSFVEIDHVWRAPSYEAGWGKVPENFGVRRESAMVKGFPPDQPPKGITFAPFPSIGPMWFHYANPVSGRIPKDYWPD
jgi:hypothetical protein